MTKVFHFDSLREHYTCDAAVVCCFDHRVQLAFSKFLTRAGMNRLDVIKIAGGAKCLASPERASERDFILDQIAVSVRLHATKLVIVMVHSDCGAYGGLAGGFGNNAQLEAEHHAKELETAARIIRERIPAVTVGAYFVDFEGVWEVELPEAISAPVADK